MYSSRKDILQIETVKEIVESYNSTYDNVVKIIETEYEELK